MLIRGHMLVAAYTFSSYCYYYFPMHVCFETVPVGVCICVSSLLNANQWIAQAERLSNPIAAPLCPSTTGMQCSKAGSMEYGQCVVVGDWLCYWPTIYPLTSCFPLCLSSHSLKVRLFCYYFLYVNLSASIPVQRFLVQPSYIWLCAYTTFVFLYLD